MKIADGELRQLLTYDVKLPPETVRELVADSKQTGHSLLQIVLASKLVPETPLAQAQAKRLGVPFVDLENTTVTSKALHRLPRQIAAKYRVICFDETSTSIKLAMADPRDEQARKAVKEYTHKTVRRYQATDKGLTKVIRQYSKADTPLHFSTRDLLATILEQAINSGSQDIHFEPHDEELIIKRRAGKQLRVMSTLPAAKLRPLISWCKLQTGNDVGDTERAHHGRFSITLDGNLHDVMMSTVPVTSGEKMVLRLLPSATSIPSLSAIGYDTKKIFEIKQIIEDGRGLVIIAGDSTSKVASTLASLTKHAASQPHTTVTTIEESLTYQISHANQVEVTATLPFSDAVTSSITQNPSIIATNQLGKSADAEQLIDFALSQHLVMSGLYAHSLVSALSQLTKYPLAPALLAASLRLVVVQHQVEALCSKCRISFAPAGPLKKALWEQFGFTAETRLYRKGPGCQACEDGNDGTVMAAEWLPVTHEFQQLVASKADQQTIADYLAAHSGFAYDLGKLASRGMISIDDAGRLAAHR